MHTRVMNKQRMTASISGTALALALPQHLLCHFQNTRPTQAVLPTQPCLSESGMQVEQQEHLRAFYSEHDPSKRTQTFANAVFTIPTDSKDEMAPFGGPLADLLPRKAHLQRLERGAVAKVRPLPRTLLCTGWLGQPIGCDTLFRPAALLSWTARTALLHCSFGLQQV